jgi:hypothetical protein
MKKAQATLILIGSLVMIGIIGYFYGWYGGEFVVLVIGIGIIYLIVSSFYLSYNIGKPQIQKQKKFDNLALYVLHNPLHPDEAEGMILQLDKFYFSRSGLIRDLQTIRDSIEIALTSKRRDTAEAHMNTALELYGLIRKGPSASVSKEVYNEIDRVVQEARNEFLTKWQRLR